MPGTFSASTLSKCLLTCLQGFVSGGFLNVYVDQKFGFGKVSYSHSACASKVLYSHPQAIVFGAIFQMCGYIIMAPHPPFAAIVVAYGCTGFGMSYMVRIAVFLSLFFAQRIVECSRKWLRQSSSRRSYEAGVPACVVW